MPTHAVVTDIYQKVAEFLRAKKRFALAVVMNDAGSTPRKAGTKAIIDEDGSIWGTIGGGLLESIAMKMAVEAIATGKPRIFEFKFAGTSAAEDKPVCGGNMQILIDPTAAESAQYYYNICHLIEKRQRGVVLRIILNEPEFVTIGLVDASSWPIQNDPLIQAARRVAASEQAEYSETASG
jgi:xanthine dehydrogenase accessory factor